LRRDGRLRPASWAEALAAVAQHFVEKGSVFVVDPGIPCEEFAFWAGLAREVGATLCLGGREAGAWPLPLGGAEDLASADLILRPMRLSRHEGFMVGLRLRELRRQGTAVVELPRSPKQKRVWEEVCAQVRQARAPLFVVEAPWAEGDEVAMARALCELNPRLKLFSPQGSLNLALHQGVPSEPPDEAQAVVFVGVEPQGQWYPLLKKARYAVIWSPWPPRSAHEAQALLPYGLALEAGGTYWTPGGRAVTVTPVLVPAGERRNTEVLEELEHVLRVRLPREASQPKNDPGAVALRASGVAWKAGEALQRRGIKLFR
ncbi:MAG: hypothetical protein ACK42E_00595, partial [Candidatus Bipolaricaulaceae bacterium]